MAKKIPQKSFTLDQIITYLTSLSNPENVAGMARFAIKGPRVLGVNIPVLRTLAKEIGKDHLLALQLWDSGIHEARILASMIAEPKEITEMQMEQWCAEFYSWDLCDQTCMNLFVKTPFAREKIDEWCARQEEFVKRAGFVLMACFVNYGKKLPNDFFIEFFPLIKREANDDRNFVKKAVNWALRQIGKRNIALNTRAIACAQEIQQMSSKTARWIAADALRDIQREEVITRLKKKEL